MVIVWIAPRRERCGVSTYSRVLIDALSTLGVDVCCIPVEGASQPAALETLAKADIVHVQHEYEFFGGRNPFTYRYPQLVKNWKKVAANARFVITLHSVIAPPFCEFQVWPFDLRRIIQKAIYPFARKSWIDDTLRPHDRVIIQLPRFLDWIKPFDTRAELIPLYTPVAMPAVEKPSEAWLDFRAKHRYVVCMFGFVSYEKGQDILIRAARYLPEDFGVIVAGVNRRARDLRYLNYCRSLIQGQGMQDRLLLIDRFLTQDELESLFSLANLSISPFRVSCGSASIAEAFARGVPVLASDIEANRELAMMSGGAVALFKTGSYRGLARSINDLCNSGEMLKSVTRLGLGYAQKTSPKESAVKHLAIYNRL